MTKEIIVSTMAADDDPVRDVLAANVFSDQRRKISSEQFSPTAFGMRNRSTEPRETVPNSLRRK